MEPRWHDAAHGYGQQGQERPVFKSAITASGRP